jgi:nitrite reductase/ring-hydroxylating ferredoxin subunit
MTQDVCAAHDLAPGEMVSAAVGSTPIVVIRTGDGALHALLDRCIHQGGPLSRGRLLAATDGDRVGEYREDAGKAVLKCPWHGFEFDVSSGCALFDRRRRVRRFDVREEGGRVVVER